MKRFLFFLTGAMLCSVSMLQAQIAVPAGGVTLNFSSIPADTEWNTYSVPGAGTTADTDAFMDTWMTTNAIPNITGGTNTLRTLAADATSSKAYWNSTSQRLVTQPTANAGTLLIAHLQNTSPGLVDSLSVSYTMFCGAAGTTTGDPIFGHRIFYSLTGNAGDWHPGLVPDQVLTAANTSAPKSFTLTSLGWAAGSLLYIVWADDNGGPNPDGDFGIDDITF
ncbi:MAG TPA: hypothetical protein VGE41_08420, partial [Verrucomicrobiae bacterium]